MYRVRSDVDNFRFCRIVNDSVVCYYQTKKSGNNITLKPEIGLLAWIHKRGLDTVTLPLEHVFRDHNIPLDREIQDRIDPLIPFINSAYEGGKQVSHYQFRARLLFLSTHRLLKIHNLVSKRYFEGTCGCPGFQC